MITESIQVENLKCEGCVATVKKKLLSLSGVNEVLADLEQKIITIVFDKQLMKTDCRDVLKQLGYPEQGTGNSYQKMKSFVSCAVGKMS